MRTLTSSALATAMSLYVILTTNITLAAEEGVQGKIELAIAVGVVKVAKDADAKLTAIKIKSQKHTYNIELDDKGKQLAELNGSRVQAIGIVLEKQGGEAIRMRLSTYKLILTGIVSLTKDDKGNVTAAKLTVDKDIYNIIMDDVGKRLAALDGSRVDVYADISTKDGAKWLTVKAFKKLAAEENKG